MRLPTINQYLESVSNPRGLFRTLGEPVIDRDCYRQVKLCAGRSAVVFRILEDDGRVRLLKCFLRAPQFPRAVYDYVRTADDPLLARVEYLEKELYVFDANGRGAYYDVAAGDWTEGQTLESRIRKAALGGDREALAALAATFDALARQLLGRPWAHGDLKPENIIVGADGRMTLIDYDAMYIPSLAGYRTTEIGTVPYQHPLRDGTMFDKHVDDYPIAMISVSLHALAHDSALYARYNTGDNIILNPAGILAGNSPLHEALLLQWKTAGRQRLYHLTRLLSSPSPRLDHLPEIMAYGLRGKDDAAPAGENLTLFIRDGKWGFMNPAGEQVIEAQYDRALPFSHGLAAVCLAGAWYFIDRRGQIVINCSQYQEVKPFQEGLAAIKRHGSWGYIDLHGHVVIPPCFNIACHMCEGRAVVKFGALYGYIDSCGRWAIEPRFEMAYNFRGGVACVRQNEVLRKINENGEFIE